MWSRQEQQNEAVFIGNDICSLLNTWNVRGFLSPGYLKKAFTPAEVKYLQRTPDIISCAALFWTCKESAYKIMVKEGYTGAFVPGKFFCRPTASNERYTWCTVFSESNIIYTKSRKNITFIETVACTDFDYLESIKTGRRMICRNDRETESNAAKDLLLKEIRQLTGVPAIACRIEKKGTVPGLTINGRDSDIEISVSHDFPYIFVALMLKR
ncbi:MAG: 4'-phosphopantetheinyl transferase superfamily protein [Bacteroidetes bacterium]|nr:4'-phosphopantetheinyl transferase superfamily protein [Bacteroidota bacterium]